MLQIATARNIGVRDSERGSALLGVLLLLLMMTALASALAVSGRTETLISRNHNTTAQARLAAEAGLSHASSVTFDWLLQWKAHDYIDVSDAINHLLADPTLISEIAFDTKTPLTSGVFYKVSVMDEDDLDRHGAPVEPGDVGEDGTEEVDTNKTLVLQATGYGQNSAEVVIEATISSYKLPAIVTNGDLTLDGSSALVIHVGSESYGGVHANGNLTFIGTPEIAGVPDATKGTATAGGECDACTEPTITSNPAASGGEMPLLDLPDIEASDFSSWADRVLVPNGTTGSITDADGNPLCATTAGDGAFCEAAWGWKYDSSNQEWELSTVAATGYTYYVQGKAKISAGSLFAPVQATVIAEDSITANSGYLIPDAGDLMFVTDGDLVIGGTFAQGAEGQVLVHEQIAVSGDAVLMGQIVVENAASVSEEATTSSIGGNVVITNNQDIGSSLFHVSGWRDVR